MISVIWVLDPENSSDLEPLLVSHGPFIPGSLVPPLVPLSLWLLSPHGYSLDSPFMHIS